MKRIRRVLGIDPGLANTGFGIIDDFGGRMSLVGYGVIETSPEDAHPSRLLEIFRGIEEVVGKYAPDESAMEELFFGRNSSSAMMVAEAKGVVTMALAKNGISPAQYKPNKIKASVTGTQSARKETVERCVRMLLNLKETPRPDHAADAIAAAITHIHSTATPAAGR